MTSGIWIRWSFLRQKHKRTDIETAWSMGHAVCFYGKDWQKGRNHRVFKQTKSNIYIIQQKSNYISLFLIIIKKNIFAAFLMAVSGETHGKNLLWK